MSETRLFFWLFCLLQVTLSEISDVVDHEPVQASVGDDVILPCHLKPSSDVTDLTVKWARNGSTVHVYRHGKDDHDLQDEHFRGRTSLFHQELVKGNISLKLTNVTEDDSGLYSCYVPRLKSQGTVSLTVNPQKDPGGGANETREVNEQIRDNKTGIFLGSILGVLLIIAVSAVIIYSVNKKTGFIKRRRNNQECDQPGGQQNPEERIPMNPVVPVPE